MTAVASRERKRRLNRVRVARHAARLDAGIAIAREVEYTGDVLNMLVRLGWLTDKCSYDQKQVSRAISALLADAAKNFS